MSGFNITGQASKFTFQELDTLASKLGDKDVVRGKAELKREHLFFGSQIEVFTLYQKTKTEGTHKVEQRLVKQQSALSHIRLALMSAVKQLPLDRQEMGENALSNILSRNQPKSGDEMTGAQLKEIVRLSKEAIATTLKWVKPMDRRDELVPIKGQLINNALNDFRNVQQGTMLAAASPTRLNATQPQKLSDSIGIALGELQIGQKIPFYDEKDKEMKERTINDDLNTKVNIMRSFWSSEQVLPDEKLAGLSQSPHVKNAIGNMAYSKEGKEVKGKDSSPQEKHQAAQGLRDYVQNQLSIPERNALKERIHYMRELAVISHDRIGSPHENPKNYPKEMDLAYWQRGVAVSGGTYLGLAPTGVSNMLGVKTNKEANAMVNNTVFALIMHYDTVFGPEDNVQQQPPPPQQQRQPVNTRNENVNLLNEINQLREQQIREENEEFKKLGVNIDN
ncbi:MAG: hypothetical protein ACO1TE_18885 [Prosthecobacter sp.]